MVPLASLQTPRVEESLVEGREEDATAVIDVGCGGLGSDGEQGEAWLERLFGNGNAHCHLPVRQQVGTVGR